jgi:hypothetical protein
MVDEAIGIRPRIAQLGRIAHPDEVRDDASAEI